MNDHSERLHALHSPSSLEPKEGCPGFQNKEGESVYASAGEACHEALEAKVNGDDSLHQKLPEDLSHFVTEAFNYVEPRIAGAEKIITEQRLYHKHPLLKQMAHGTADLIAITGKTAQLLDYKMGRRPVTKAENNIQGWTYATALFDTYEEIEEITVHFVAPRVNEGTTNFTFRRSSDYERMLARVLRVVERACLPEEEQRLLLCPNWSNCIYCGVKKTCSALARAVETAFAMNQEKEFTPENVRTICGKADGETPEDLAFSYELAAVVKDWAEQRQEYVKQKAMEGNEISGYEIRFNRGRTTVQTVDKVVASGVELTLDQIKENSTIPLVDLKRVYTQGTPTSEKRDKERELMEKLAKGGALKSGEESCYLYRLNQKE